MHQQKAGQLKHLFIVGFMVSESCECPLHFDMYCQQNDNLNKWIELLHEKVVVIMYMVETKGKRFFRIEGFNLFAFLI